MKNLIIFLSLFHRSLAIYYDSYSGNTLSDEDVERHNQDNTTFWCVKDILPCDPCEGRRVDGSCNNLQYPSIGAIHTPNVRLLPPDYTVDDRGYEPRKAASGQELPLVRRLRTEILAEGRVPSPQHTQLFTHYWVFVVSDFLSQQDTVKYVIWKPYCCKAIGKLDPACVPSKVPDDDPVLRFTNIRCINMTRPESYQSVGCLPKNTVPERIVSATPAIDLSNVYGASAANLLNFRTFSGGLLKVEIDDGTTWPPSYKGPNICFMNQPPFEKRCHKTPEDITNTILGINLYTIWFWRNHNVIATRLAEVNPCWSDQQLFDTARDINIATHSQILYYEAMPLLMGRANLIRDGVISISKGFRDIYDPRRAPCTSLEQAYAFRWMHTMQDGALKLYDPKGYYLNQVPLVNITDRTGFLALDRNLAKMTQGSIHQHCAAPDYVVDPDIAELGLGPLQQLLDITNNDLAKGRYFGFQPYVKYREVCFGKKITCWEDFLDFMDPERVDILRENYGCFSDVDVLAGMWSERHYPGSICPSMFYCIAMDQFVRNVVSDRHWYERRNRPKAFTLPQLLEVRKRTMSSMMCDVGDSITEIQPSSFTRISPSNKLTPCNKISKFDYTKWKDPACKC